MKNLLFIWYQKPQAIPNGGDRCSLRNYQLCCNVFGEENIHSMYIHNHHKRWADILTAPFLFKKGYYYGLNPARLQQIVQMAQEFDCVFVDRSLFGIIAYQLRQNGFKGTIIAHFHNVERHYFDQAKLPKWFPLRNIIIQCADMNDRWSMQYADKTIALNRRDDQELFTLYGRHAELLLPIALPDKNIIPQKDAIVSRKPVCLTIGAFFEPNNEGILWFIKNVLPYVNITYKIVGKDMHRLKEAYPKLLSDIEVISNAESLAPYFQEADIMILPIFSGSGMKVKTCESLMYGKNILGTSEAFEGYEGDYVQIGGKCDTAEDFISRINEYSIGKHLKFNEYSRRLFLENYSYEVVYSKFMELFHQ